MAIKKITLTQDHISLIKNLKFERFNFDDKEKVELLKKYALELKLKPKDDPKKQDENDFTLKQIREFNTPSRYGWGIDQWNIFGGSLVLEDIALILGKMDQAIEGSENSASGRRFPEELENYMWDLYRYICDNMEYILSLVFFYSTKGGISPGTYKCIDNVKIWEKIS